MTISEQSPVQESEPILSIREHQPGDILRERYRIIKPIGRGGMGAVYMAEDIRLEGRLTAVKEITLGFHETEREIEENRRQFHREASTLARLDHPTLPKVSDFFVIDDRDFLVMDFIPGRDLRELIEEAILKGTYLPEKDILNWAAQLAEALNYLHSQDPPILHRDIKPANIKIMPNGFIKLVDFGLVKILNSDESRTITVVQGRGSAHYTPLEQYGGDTGHTDIRSDVYAFGATLYHLATNRPPLEAKQRFLAPRALQDPREFNPDLSERTVQAILWAIAMHPDRRPRNILELRDALAGDKRIPYKTSPGLRRAERTQEVVVYDPEMAKGNVVLAMLATLLLIAAIFVTIFFTGCQLMRIIILLVLVTSFLSFANPTTADTTPVETVLDSMTLQEKVGQMFMTNIFGKQLGIDGVNFIQTYHPGGVAIFGYNTNGSTPQELAAFINALQETATTSGAAIPLIIATDHEGGLVQRVTQGVTALPDPLGFGATTENGDLIRMGQRIGDELAAMGINMNLAPVADLHTREDMLNTYRVMHRRTFGDDPERVGLQAAAYAEGLAQSNVIGVLKHFPGHGGATDSHVDIPRVTLDRETAFATALHTFEIAIQQGIPAIMVGHLYYSAIEPTPNLPASLSPTMMHILRDDFGFEGVIMTDAMNMAAILDNYTAADATLQFVQAGGDLIVAGPYLSLKDQRDSMQAIIDAVEAGSLPESRIDESVRRILQMKADYKLLDWQPVNTASMGIDLAATQQALIDTFMDAATAVRDNANLLPVMPDDDIAIIYPGWHEDILNTCGAFAPDATLHGYPPQVAQWEFGVVKQLGQEHDKIIIFTEDAFTNPGQQHLVRLLPPEKTIVAALDIPYDLEVLPPDISTYITLYNSLPASRIAACNVLFGKHPIRGRLPIAIQGYDSGSGIDIP